jgi:hypothetical protein
MLTGHQTGFGLVKTAFSLSMREIVMSAAIEDRPSDSFGSDAEVFMYDPPAFFDRSYTKQHSIARDRMEELQLAALTLRFNQGLGQVAMVSKLAGRQGITQVSEFDDVVPLLFEHTMYKSYPLSLLERQQFDKLSSWVSKLTPLDLSAVDASKCDSIDSWLAVPAPGRTGRPVRVFRSGRQQPLGRPHDRRRDRARLRRAMRVRRDHPALQLPDCPSERKARRRRQDLLHRDPPLTFVVVYHQILQGGYVVIDEAPAGTREQNLPDKEQFLWNTAASEAPASRSAAYA